MVILHLIVDTQDAMGANAVNSMAESLAPKIEEWTGGRVNLRTVSYTHLRAHETRGNLVCRLLLC